GKIDKKAAKEIVYTNVGTIEFLVDEEENFYFLEMNTRIQVEHAITEEISNQDIVQMQIEIASDKKLALPQEEVQIYGHAIEARIYAEDPVKFFPSPGKIKTYKEPKGEHIRIETSIEQGTEITPYYDPMISKLIVWGKSRKESIQYMLKALEEYKIEGIKTNLPMLKEVIQHNQFKKGLATTKFVEDYYIPLL